MRQVKILERCLPLLMLFCRDYIVKYLHYTVLKDVSGSVCVQMPDVWINLAYVYFAREFCFGCENGELISSLNCIPLLFSSFFFPSLYDNN